MLFYCEKCLYQTANKKDYLKHSTTRKHLNTYQYLPKIPKNPQIPFFCECGKEYKHKQSLYNHKRSCISGTPENHIMVSDGSSNEMQMLANMFMEVVKQNSEFKELIIDQNNKLIDLSTKHTAMTNCHNTNTINNNKFNLNVFLNEKCKDAMNIGDFVNSLQLRIQDLENTGEYGFAEGISRIFMRGLKELDVYKRPIHCSDLKREIIHVKSENKWEKEGSERMQLKKAIKQIANKNICMIPAWKKANPGCDKYDSRKNDKYLKLMVESMGPTDEREEEKDFNKIIRFVARETAIEKDGLEAL